MTDMLPFWGSIPQTAIVEQWKMSLLGSIVTIVVLALLINASQPQLKVPILLEKEFRSAAQRAKVYSESARELLLRGHKEFGEKPWGITTQNGVKLVVPPSFYDELKSHPHLNFKEAIDQEALFRFTKFGGPPQLVIDAIRSKMNPSLNIYTPILHAIIKGCVSKIAPDAKDFKLVNIYPKIVEAVQQSTARIFHSEEASKDPEWVDVSTKYIQAVGSCMRGLRKHPAILRPILFRFMWQRKAIETQFQRASNYISNSLAQRRVDPPAEPTMLDHLTTGKNATLADDLDAQVLYQMTLVAVGAVTTLTALTHSVYDLAAYPEYSDMILEESESSDRDNAGHFTKIDLANWKKIDSFMKESSRMNGIELVAFHRAATDKLTLSDGTFIPKGTRMFTPISALHFDGDYWKEPNKFDPLRAYRWRQEEGKANKHMYVSVSKNEVGFGYGRHACPGRFLSETISKLFLAELVQQYEVKMPAGQGRLKNEEFQDIVEPDPHGEILMRRK
ncbi:hypothetical protein ACHAPJ_009754 [Fusarium lateritium]